MQSFNFTMGIKLVSIILYVCAVTLSCTQLTDSPVPVVGVCLQNGKIERFDNNTHKCINNRVVERKINTQISMLKPTPLPLSLSGTLSATKTTSKPCSIVDKNSDILKCGSVKLARKSRGYQCCGYQAYHPDFETCCVQMVYRYKVHSGKKHKDHVCCGMNVYRRNNTMPCQHPARNDKLWKSNKRFMKNYKARSNCPSKKHEYLMRVGVRDKQHNFQFYHANITKLENGRRADTQQVKVAIDQFSPKRTMKAKSFLIISDTIYKNDFYLGFNDIVMKMPRKMRTFWKRFKRIQKECRKLGNRLHRREDDIEQRV